MKNSTSLSLLAAAALMVALAPLSHAQSSTTTVTPGTPTVVEKNTVTPAAPVIIDRPVVVEKPVIVEKRTPPVIIEKVTPAPAPIIEEKTTTTTTTTK